MSIPMYNADGTCVHVQPSMIDHYEARGWSRIPNPTERTIDRALPDDDMEDNVDGDSPRD